MAKSLLPTCKSVLQNTRYLVWYIKSYCKARCFEKFKPGWLIVKTFHDDHTSASEFTVATHSVDVDNVNGEHILKLFKCHVVMRYWI